MRGVSYGCRPEFGDKVAAINAALDTVKQSDAWKQLCCKYPSIYCDGYTCPTPTPTVTTTGTAAAIDDATTGALTIGTAATIDDATMGALTTATAASNESDNGAVFYPGW